MEATVVTSFSETGLHEYGWRFMETFFKFWPKDHELVVYYERNEPKMFGPVYRDLTLVGPRAEFMWLHGTDPAKRGREVRGCWKLSEREQGHSFRTDAIKFCNKVFAIEDALDQCETDFLVWMDADSYSFAQVPEVMVQSMLIGTDVAFLGRVGNHTECGFVAFRLPEAAPLIREWARIYSSGEVFDLNEWHDSYVFDVARSRVRLRENNLTAHVQAGERGNGHPWFASQLGRYCDHLKGERKVRGFSSEMAPFHRRRG